MILKHRKRTFKKRPRAVVKSRPNGQGDYIHEVVIGDGAVLKINTWHARKHFGDPIALANLMADVLNSIPSGE